MTHVATVTVDPTTPNAAHQDFPQYIDLADMPAEFWSTVSSHIPPASYDFEANLDGFTEEDGTWQISSGRASPLSAPASTFALLVENKSRSPDVDLSTTVRSGNTNSGHGGALFRYSDNNNWLAAILDWTDDTLSLIKCEAGTVTDIAEISGQFGLPSNGDRVIRVVTNGDSIKVSYQGDEYIDEIVSFNNTASRFGMCGDSDYIRFEDWHIDSGKSGGDIRCFLPDGTELPREVVSCDTTAETGELHVLFPEFNLVTDNIIEIHADGTSSDYAVTGTYGRNAVWGDYEAVLHGNSATVNATGGASFTQIVGDSPSITTLNGRSAVNVPSNAILAASLSGTVTESSQMTVQFYGAPLTDPWTGDFGGAGFVLQGGIGGNDFTVYNYQSGSPVFRLNTIVPQNQGNSTGTSTLTDAQQSEYFTSATFDGVDAVEAVTHKPDNARTLSATRTPASVNFDNFAIGGRGDSSETPYGGIYIEARGRESALSADWITDEYTNQSNPTAFYTVSAAGGGGGATVEEVSVSYSMNLATTQDNDAVAEASQAHALTLFLVNAAGATSEADFSAGLSLGYNTTSALVVSAAITSDTTLGATQSAEATAEGSQSSSTILGMTTTGAVEAAGEAEGLVTFGLNIDAQATADAQSVAQIAASIGLTATAQALTGIDAAITINNEYGVTAIGDTSIEAGFNLTAELSAQMAAEAQASAALVLNVDLATAIVAEALTQAGVSFATISGVDFTGSTITAGYQTPDGRTFTVSADVRAFTVSARSRVFIVED